MTRFAVFIILALYLFVPMAHAGSTANLETRELSLAEIPKLNREVTITKEQFDKDTKLIEEAPLNNRFLAFRLRLPKDWTRLNTDSQQTGVTLSRQVLSDMVQYFGPPSLDIRSSFRFRVIELAFDVTAKDWFLSYIFNNNYSLQGLDVTSTKRVQAQYVLVENGRQSIVRSVTEISGNRLIVAEYIVPIDLWQTNKNYAKRAMASFTLANRDPSPVEKMESFAFVDVAKIDYPTSWILKNLPITSIERMGASLLNIRGGSNKGSRKDGLFVDGSIDISIVTKSAEISIGTELANLKQQLLEKNLVLGKLIEPIEGWSHHPAITSGKIEVYSINDKNNNLSNYEEWIGVFETGSRYYFIRLLTVGRQDNYLTWARNIQAYRNVISSLAPII